MTKIWINVWSEISKDWEFSRPVLVMKSHLWWDLVWVIPFTSKYSNRYSKFLLEFEDFEKYGLSQKSYLILNQFKIISLKRLDRKLNDTAKKWIYRHLVEDEKINNISNELKTRIL
jgi:mRNA-degrading endonuclease toxin of MazEF toxin-antitoxin module